MQPPERKQARSRGTPMLKNNSRFTETGAPGRRVHLRLDRMIYRSIATASLFCSLALSTFGQTPVLTQHNDALRTGQNTTETILNTSNVNVNQFGKLFSLPTDGQVYAQPLYVPGVTINGAVHNVLIVATEADSVYAFDADSNSAPLWKASLVDAAHGAGAGETPLNSSTTIGCTDLQPKIGITSTPVIDPVSHTIYVEAKSTNGSSFFHRLHALDPLTGNEKSPGPIKIAATVAGTGDGSTSGQLVFDSNTMSLHQQARPGLLLMNGTIYIAFASHCDFGPYHGWLFAYDAATFTRKSVYVTTPNGGLGGFWMSGAGVAGDSGGNIYIASGNGDFDTTNVPARETGDTLLKLGTTNQILTMLDYFTPLNQNTLNSNDTDLGSGGVLLLPDQPGSFPHILAQAGKEGRIYVVNRDQLTTGNTHYCTSCTNDTEIIEESSSGAVGGMWGMPAYWNNNIYFWGSGDVLKSIPITSGLPDFTHLSSNSTSFGFPGATPSISSNGTAAGTAILWAIDSSQYGSPGPGPGPAVLYAYDATNVSKELWNSAQSANNRDRAGNAVKFSTPTISNGKVYVGTSGEVDVYGLLGSGVQATATPQISPAAGSYTSSVTVTITDATSGATITYTTDGTTPIPGSHGTAISSGGSFTLTSSATVEAIAAAPNLANSAVASGSYTIQSNSTSSINYSAGLSATGLALSGSATINGSRLRLTDTTGNQAGSAFFSTPVNVQSFTTDFSFQLTTANADGFAFTIHGGSTAAALGPLGGGLGYGPDTPGGTPGIPSSIAVKFDLYDNSGEGIDSTGIYTNGASPTTPAVDMTASGVNLHSGDVFQVHMSYNGTNLAMTITDVSTGKSFSQTFLNINIPGVVGGSTAYVGFTGGTGGLTAIQEIINWSYTSGSGTPSQAATPQISPAAGSYTSSVTVTITDATSGATITYTTDGTTPIPGSHGTAISSGGSFTLTSSATVEAIASAAGFTPSAVTSATFTVLQPAPTPQIGPAPGTFTNSVNVTITDSNTTAAIIYTTDGTTPTPTHGTTYNGSFTLTSSATVKAIATASGFSPSGVASAAYTISSPLSPAPMPTFLPTGGTITTSQTITISDTASSPSIFYTTDGTTPSTTVGGSTLQYSAPFTLPASTTVNAVATASGFSPSPVGSATYTVQGPPPSINFGSGFTGETTLSLNGGTTINGSRLHLTDAANQARSAFFTSQVNVQSFTNDFSFQLTNPNADGATFTIQGNNATVVGPPGGGLGYGPDTPGAAPGILKSVAVKLDLFDNAGEGSDSTGEYENGVSPTTPTVDMTASGVNLHSGDIMNVHMTYDGTTLTWTVSDPTAGKSFTTSKVVNIPLLVGGNTAFAGFTGGTGGATATQEILTWTFTSGAPASAPNNPIQYENESSAVFNSSLSSGPTYRVIAWTGFTDGSGTTLDGTAAGQSVTITLNIPQTGIYDIRFATKKYTTRGIVQLSINGTNVGPAEDEYAANVVWQEFDLGNVALTAGNQPFKFTSTGKNASSSGFTQAFDYIKLTPQ